MVEIKEFMGLLVLLIIIGGFILRAKKPKIPAWSIMSFAGSISVLFGLIPIDKLNYIINWNLILLLIGMFSIVGIIEESGLIDYFIIKLSRLTKSKTLLLYIFSLFFAIAASFMVNDAVAIFGVGFLPMISRILDMPLEPLAFLLVFSITIGSAMTPIGNPQNMLIATEASISAPFVTFFKYLAVPTFINLCLTTYILAKIYRVKRGNRYLNPGLLIQKNYLRNKRDAYVGLIGLALTIFLMLLNDFLEMFRLPHVTQIGLIPFVIASFSYIFVSSPREVLSKVNWSAIIFFIAMFIASQGIWNSTLLSYPLHYLLPRLMNNTSGFLRITLISLLFSQLLSNVPFTNIFILYLHNLGYSSRDVLSWITFSMSSTIAGNFTILGAISNVIILDSLETRFNTSISYARFIKLGVMITLVNVSIYLLYIIALSYL
ncbi:MAG: anion permease [Caldisphaeraceae archaeon]|nr:anion permease [Caldisphaeraceae archaeon]